MLEPTTVEVMSCPNQPGNPPEPDQDIEEIAMHRRKQAADLGRPPAPGTAATASHAPGPPDLVHRRQLEKSISWSGRERLRCLWYRLRLTVAEMNYATRRMAELQAPWIADDNHPR
jgi:hypothetical protein